jgi:hypothetical protein
MPMTVPTRSHNVPLHQATHIHIGGLQLRMVAHGTIHISDSKHGMVYLVVSDFGAKLMSLYRLVPEVLVVQNACPWDTWASRTSEPGSILPYPYSDA